MEAHASKSSAGSSSNDGTFVSEKLNVDNIDPYFAILQEEASTPTNEGRERNEGPNALKPLSDSRKRPLESPSAEDNGERRVRTRPNNTPQERAILEDPSTSSPIYTNNQTQDILKIMEEFAAVTGQIVASIFSTGDNPRRQIIVTMLREALGNLVPCVTEIRDAGALGIEIIGLAGLVDPSLQGQSIITIISSPYASSVLEPLKCDYTARFTEGDMFWDRVTEFAANPYLKPGEKAAPSSQGLVCVAFRLHLVTKVTPRNIWTAPGRLRGGKGLANLHQHDHWMYIHLHNPDIGSLENGRGIGNGTPHHSLEFEPEKRRTSQAVDQNTHFCALDAEPHRPTMAMVPAGYLKRHSRKLFLGIKVNAHSGRIIERPSGMDEDAVKRGLQLADQPPDDMPLPTGNRSRDHLFSELQTHPSRHDGPEKLLRESSAFSSRYSASDCREEAQASVVSPPVIPLTTDRTPIDLSQDLPHAAPHPQQQAPVQSFDKPRKPIHSSGKKVDTAVAGKGKARSHALTKPETNQSTAQPSVTARDLYKQHNGASINSNSNARDQAFNFNHSSQKPSPSPDETRHGGGNTF